MRIISLPIARHFRWKQTVSSKEKSDCRALPPGAGNPARRDWSGKPRPAVLERETGLEPATFCLGSRRSTTELFPHVFRSNVWRLWCLQLLPGGAGSVPDKIGDAGNYSRASLIQHRVYRLGVWLPSVLLAIALVFSGPPAAAASTADNPLVLKAIVFSADTYQRGFSFTTADGEFRLSIPGGALPAPGTVTITKLPSDDVLDWKNLNRDSHVYQVTYARQDGPAELSKPLTFEFVVLDTGYRTSVGKLNPDGQSWEELGSALNRGGARVRSADDQATFTVAAFQDESYQEGIATYYGTYVRKTRLSLVAASNHFPYGTVLRVTNLENNKMVTVRVVDTGGFRYPRIIDLSTPAFAKIQPTWKGVARVRVEIATPQNRPPTESPQGGDETPPGAPVASGATPPTSSATASIVVDAATGQKLVGKKTSTAFPIASLTKVMTAAVFMDTKPNLNQVVTYTKQDDIECSCLRLADGEQVTLKDLLFASLVGSANNATLALVRATGLPRQEFVQRMNDKAMALGLKQTSYVDPTGLEKGNVSSAEDLAAIGRIIPDTYPTLKRALSTKTVKIVSKNKVCSAPFRQKDGSCVHTLTTTNKLLGKTSFDIVSAKTGFIDEARHTLLVRARNKAGHDVVLVFLRVQNRADSFAFANQLIEWTFKNYRWA